MSVSECDSQVIFEVRVFTSFGSVSFTPCTLNANQTGAGPTCIFSPGTGRQIIGVKASYPRPFIIPWVGACLSGGSCWAGLRTTKGSNAGIGTATLTSTLIFQNEPFL
jgi:hypothetical protein